MADPTPPSAATPALRTPPAEIAANSRIRATGRAAGLIGKAPTQPSSSRRPHFQQAATPGDITFT